MLEKTFIIDGGAGRIITSIPALEKYVRLNPSANPNILVNGWDNVFWGNEKLQKYVSNIATKGLFERIKNTKVVAPEPYYSTNYINQKISIAEAFDEIINETDIHADLESPKLYVTKEEHYKALHILRKHLTDQNKTKVLVLQPFASSTAILEGEFIDPSNRSLQKRELFSLVNKLKNTDYLVIYFGEPSFNEYLPNGLVIFNDANTDLRVFISIISVCDYFIGVDSVGQHIAKAFNIPGTVFMGSTFEINSTYPSHFKIIRNGRKPTYMPLRLLETDCLFASRLNDNIMQFTDEQLDNALPKEKFFTYE